MYEILNILSIVFLVLTIAAVLLKVKKQIFALEVLCWVQEVIALTKFLLDMRISSLITVILGLTVIIYIYRTKYLMNRRKTQ